MDSAETSEPSVFQFPETPEQVENCPKTPSPHKTETNGRVSPLNSPSDQICSICLDKMSSKSQTDNCQHQFCFPCIKRWSEVKSECPLCKKPFQVIKHHVNDGKSIEYQVQQRPQPVPVHDFFHDFFNIQQRERLQRVSLYFPRVSLLDADLQEYDEEAPLFANLRMLRTRRRFAHNPLQRALEMRGVAPRSSGSGAHVQSGGYLASQRREFYDQGLYSLPVTDAQGRYREISPEFYRENPAQTHRIVAWMNRELVTLLPNMSALDIQLILDHAHNMLSIHSMTSTEFRNHFEGYLGQNVNQFIHELLNFARSPYDMSGYDDAVQFQERARDSSARTSNVQEVSSASEPETEEGVSRALNRLLNSLRTTRNRRVRPNRLLSSWQAPTAASTSSTSTSTNTSPRSTPQANHTRDSVIVERNSNSVDLASSFRDVVPSDIINLVMEDETLAIPSLQLPDNISLSSSSSDDSELEIIDNITGAVETVERSASLPLVVNVPEAATEETIEISATSTSAPTQIESNNDNSDVEFVLALKPPHLRTPDMVSLNSESDSDVIFVGDPKGNDSSNSSDDVPLAQLKSETHHQEPGVSNLDVLASVASMAPEQNNRTRTASKPLSFSMVPRKLPPQNMGVKRMFEHDSNSSSCSSCVSSLTSSSSSENANRHGKELPHRKRIKIVKYKEKTPKRSKRKIREKPLEELPSTEQVQHDNEAGPSNAFSSDHQYKLENEARPKVKSVILKRFKNQYNILPSNKEDSSD